MKKLIFILFLTSIDSVFAQKNIKLDSLLRQLDTQKEDSTKLNTILKIAQAFESNPTQKQLEYLKLAENLAKKLKNRRKEAEIQIFYGTYYSFRGNFEKSLNYHLNCVKIAETIHDPILQIKGYLGLGQAFLHFDNQSPKAKFYYDKAENVAHKSGDSTMLGDIYLQQGFAKYYNGKFDEAIKLYLKAIEIEKKYDNKKFIGSTYNEIGLAYSQQKKYGLARGFLNKAIEVYEKLPQKPFLEMSFVNSDIGFNYLDEGKFDKSLEAFNTSLKYAALSKSAETTMENYGYLAELYEKKQDFKNQNRYLKKYYSLKDSLFSSDSKTKITELEADYKIEKSNAALAQQEAESIKSKNQRNIFLAIAILTLIFAGGLGYFYRRIQLKNRQINQQKEELQQLNHVKDRLFAILSHDLRNPLTTLKAYFSMLSLPNLSTEKKEKYTNQTLKAINSTSELMDNLLLWANAQLRNQEINLINISLQETIENVVALVKPQADAKNIEIVQQISIENVISNQNILETILRNLLTNAIKFSQNNSEIVVMAYTKHNETYISINDSGVGMSSEKIQTILQSEISKSVGTSGEKGSGIGLLLVRELTKQIKAELIIESQEGVGATFSLRM